MPPKRAVPCHFEVEKMSHSLIGAVFMKTLPMKNASLFFFAGFIWSPFASNSTISSLSGAGKLAVLANTTRRLVVISRRDTCCADDFFASR